MGGRKRKSHKIKRTVTNIKVPTTFDCIFCNNIDSTEVKLEPSMSIGYIYCRVCTANYQTTVHHLTEPIDVYWEWIDEAERVNTIEEQKLLKGESFINKDDSDASESDQEDDRQDYIRSQVVKDEL